MAPAAVSLVTSLIIPGVSVCQKIKTNNMYAQKALWTAMTLQQISV